MNNYIERFLSEKINRKGNQLSGLTKTAYEFNISQMLEYVGKRPEDITYNDLSRWFAHYREKYTTASMSQKVMTLKSYFKFLADIEIIKINPTDKFTKFKSKSKEKIPLTVEEIQAIIRQSRNSRDRAIIEVLASTAVRISELINLSIDDMQNDIIIIHGKGDETRSIFLKESVKEYINEYLKDRKDSEYNNLFISNQGTPMREDTINNMLKLMAKRANVENWERVTPHLFRATCVTLMSKNSVPVPTIQKVLGHQSIKTTMIYIKVPENQIKEAMCMNLY